MKLDSHPEQGKISTRLRRLGRSADTKFEGELFRFIHPEFTKPADIVSGKGALHVDGRWNAAGAQKLSYMAMAPGTALAEALAHVRYYNLPESKALPKVLVAVELRASRILDLRDGKLRRKLQLSEALIRTLDWRRENQKGVEAITQAWGFAFGQVGRYEAVIVPSAADSQGVNVLVLPDNLAAGSHFQVITEVRLPKP